MQTARKKRSEPEGPSDPWMSLREAARALGISYGGVLGKALRNELTTQTVAGRTFVSRESVERAKASR